MGKKHCCTNFRTTDGHDRTPRFSFLLRGCGAHGRRGHRQGTPARKSTAVRRWRYHDGIAYARGLRSAKASARALCKAPGFWVVAAVVVVQDSRPPLAAIRAWATTAYGQARPGQARLSEGMRLPYRSGLARTRRISSPFAPSLNNAQQSVRCLRVHHTESIAPYFCLYCWPEICDLRQRPDMRSERMWKNGHPRRRRHVGWAGRGQQHRRPVLTRRGKDSEWSWQLRRKEHVKERERPPVHQSTNTGSPNTLQWVPKGPCEGSRGLRRGKHSTELDRRRRWGWNPPCIVAALWLGQETCLVGCFASSAKDTPATSWVSSQISWFSLPSQTGQPLLPPCAILSLRTRARE